VSEQPSHRSGRAFVIAVDGPAGSGKSTLGRRLAQLLGLRYLDTGAIYRALTLAALRRGISPDDEAGLAALARSITISITPEPPESPFDSRIWLDGEDVTTAIRSPEVDRYVSAVSAHAAVRQALVPAQRRAALEPPGAVVVGRDIGTVVLPDADIKIYVDAAVEERARRRWREQVQRAERTGTPPPSFEAVLADLIRRDRLDSARAVSPLQPAKDAIRLDTTGLSIDEMVARALELVTARRTDGHAIAGSSDH
jgi:cytidylate kinase